MAPHHVHGSGAFDRALAIGIALNLAYVVVEASYGVIADSLALVADAGHNLSDVLGLVLAWVASRLVRRRPTPRRSYGLRRSSVLAALFNALFLLVAVGGIAWEAVGRLRDPASVAGATVIWAGLIGIAVNAGTAALLLSGQKGDLNIRGAVLHMAADVGVSLGVGVTGVVLLATGWDWLDPAMSLAVVTVIVIATWGLLRESLGLALDAVPPGIEPSEVQTYLAALPGVAAVHDLHTWAMSTTETALTAHLVIPGTRSTDETLGRICEHLHGAFGIEHATIQVEQGDDAHPCRQASADVV